MFVSSFKRSVIAISAALALSSVLVGAAIGPAGARAADVAAVARA